MVSIKARLDALAQCLCANIDGGDSMCFCGVLPGEDWYDVTGWCNEDKCGQAWVRLVQAYPAKTLTEPDTSMSFGGGNCASISLDVELGVVRCLPAHDDGSPNTEAELLEVSDQQLKDFEDIRKALQCCLQEDILVEYVLGSWTPLGPSEGSGIGGRWTATVGIL